MYILKRTLFIYVKLMIFAMKGQTENLEIVFLCINLSSIEIIEEEEKHAIYLRL